MANWASLYRSVYGQPGLQFIYIEILSPYRRTAEEQVGHEIQTYGEMDMRRPSPWS